jgi:hypothetical protein
VQVIYKEEGTMLLGLEIPVGAAINKDEIERNLKRQKLQGESGEQVRYCPSCMHNLTASLCSKIN